jgi:hypothetical protein
MLVDLRAHVIGTNAISDLISTRLFIQRVPPDTLLPHCRYFTVAEDVNNAHNDGVEFLSRDLVQFDIYSTTATEALAIKDAMKLALNSKTFTQGSTLFGYIKWENAFSGYEPASEEFSQTITVSITWSAA